MSLVATILTGAVASRTACSIARDLRRETFNKVMHFSPAEVGKFSQASLIPAAPTTFSRFRWPQPVYPHVPDGPVMGIVAVMRVWPTTGLSGPSRGHHRGFGRSACSWASPCPSSKRCKALWTA
ncbi:MAG: hypothetical protein ACLS3M_05390 [Collinsella sp.]